MIRIVLAPSDGIDLLETGSEDMTEIVLAPDGVTELAARQQGRLYRAIGGNRVRELSAEEQAAIEAEWAAEDAKGPEVPPVVTAVQLREALVAAYWITEDEADQWAFATQLPAVVQAVVDAQPLADQRRLRRLLLTMREVERVHPLVDAIATAAGQTPADADAIFIAAASVI